MACKYHPNSIVAGNCVDCGNNYCSECGTAIKRQGTQCLDCGANFARKKIFQSYVAIGIGFVAGLMMMQEEGGSGVLGLLLGPYSFFSIFWGWHYGGKIWLTISKGLDAIFGNLPIIGPAMLLTIRLFVSSLIGALGGGIIQFKRCLDIAKRQKEFSLAVKPI